MIEGDTDPQIIVYNVQTGMIAKKGLRESVYDIEWFGCSNKFVVVGSANIYIFSFDGEEIHEIKSNMVSLDRGRLSISPDDRYIAVAFDDTSTIIVYDADLIDLEEFTIGFSRNFLDIDFNPIACCGKYYFAVVGNLDQNKKLEVFEYDPENKISPIVYRDFGGTLASVVWSSNGKNIAVSGEASYLEVYKFNPQESALDYFFSYTFLDALGTTTKYIDWSACGRYFAIAGSLGHTETEDPINVEVAQVGYCITNCVVQNNRIANVKGSVCGVGIFGASCCNLIDKNYVCCYGVNFHESIHNKGMNGFLGYPSMWDNVSGNECCNSCCLGCSVASLLGGCQGVQEPCIE